MNDDTLLHRQVHPSWIQQGRVTSQAFKPTPKDNHKVSVYDGDLVDARGSWRHFTGELGCESAGVLAVSVLECCEQQLNAYPDPEPFPEHAVIDFTGHAENQIRKKAKSLRSFAQQRGWQFVPE